MGECRKKRHLETFEISRTAAQVWVEDNSVCAFTDEQRIPSQIQADRMKNKFYSQTYQEHIGIAIVEDSLKAGNRYLAIWYANHREPPRRE